MVKVRATSVSPHVRHTVCCRAFTRRAEAPPSSARLPGSVEAHRPPHRGQASWPSEGGQRPAHMPSHRLPDVTFGLMTPNRRPLSSARVQAVVVVMLMVGALLSIGLHEAMPARAAEDRAPVRVRAVAYNRLTLIAPTGSALQPEDVTVQNGQKEISVTGLERFSNGGRVLIVIDANLPSAAFEAAVGAVRELILQLPTNARTAVLDSGHARHTAVVFGKSETALLALGELEPRPVSAGYGEWLDIAADLKPEGVPLTIDYIGQASVPNEVGLDAVDRLRSSGAVLSAAVIGTPLTYYLADAPNVTGGRLESVASPRDLVSAADRLAADYRGSYQAKVPDLGSDGLISVRVTGLANVVTGVPGAVGSAQTMVVGIGDERPSRGGTYTQPWPYLAAVAALILAVSGRRYFIRHRPRAVMGSRPHGAPAERPARGG